MKDKISSGWSHFLISCFIVEDRKTPSFLECKFLLFSVESRSSQYNIPSISIWSFSPEWACSFVSINSSNIVGYFVSLEILRSVGSQAMSGSINKSPNIVGLSLMSFKLPLLLITNPVVVLNKGKLLPLPSFVSIWSLLCIMIVEVTMSRDRGFDVWFSSSWDECCSSIVVSDKFNLTVLNS